MLREAAAAGLLCAQQPIEPGYANALRPERALGDAAALLWHGAFKVARSGAFSQRPARGYGRAEEPPFRPDGRGCEEAVQKGPRSSGTDFRFHQAHASAFH